MTTPSRLLGLFLLLATCAVHAAEMSEEVMFEELRKGAAKFEAVGPIELGKPVPFKISLAANAVKLAEDAVFGGFRFTAPKGVSGSDFVWYFNAPFAWANWYIMPLSDKPRPGFKNWIYGDKIYEQFDVAGAPARMRALQTLSSDYFKEGEEYYIWFRKVQDGDDDEVRGVLTFAKPDGEWDENKIEAVLPLKPQPAAEQVKQLDSRGGRILLDEKFFEKSYADERIGSVFFSKRQTKFLPDGFFVTMETNIPPCKTQPSFAEIRKAFGEPDFTVTSEEEDKISKRKEGDSKTTTYYYDNFGFEVDPNDPKQTVQRVSANAANYATLPPKEDGKRFSQLPLKNLTCFYDDKKEVGRVYFFGESKTDAIIAMEPPVGRYKSRDEELECFGGGKWVQRNFHENGKLARIVRFENNRLNGTAEGYYPDGNKSFEAPYKNGRLDGEVVEYQEDGTVKRTSFKGGQKVVE
jgi:hypothetical protein